MELDEGLDKGESFALLKGHAQNHKARHRTIPFITPLHRTIQQGFSVILAKLLAAGISGSSHQRMYLFVYGSH